MVPVALTHKQIVKIMKAGKTGKGVLLRLVKEQIGVTTPTSIILTKPTPGFYKISKNQVVALLPLLGPLMGFIKSF